MWSFPSSNSMKPIQPWLVLIAVLLLQRPAKATLVVFYPIATGQNVIQQVVDRAVQAAQHAEDMAKYVQMIENQTQQIAQLTTIISHNTQHLQRLANPLTYINMMS